MRINRGVNDPGRSAMLGRLGISWGEQHYHVRNRITHSATWIHTGECLWYGGPRSEPARMAQVLVFTDDI